jgi:VWFA-related protein
MCTGSPKPGGQRRRLSAVTLSLALLAAPAVLAQTRQVYVTASLVDRNHLFIENLTADEVQILEDGKPRKIEFIAMEQLPTVYGILVERALMPEADVDSRSAMDGAALAKDIIFQLIDKYLGRQQVWLGTYQRDPEDLLDFTGDSFEMKEAIQKLTGPSRAAESYLYPALFSAAQKMCERSEKRRVLLLFLEATDPDTAGKIRPLRNLLASSNVELFAISFTSRLSTRGGLRPALSDASLKELAGATAGQVYSAGLSREHPEDVVRRLLQQIRTLYTFGFESTSAPDKPGKLVIQCSRPDSRVSHRPTVPVLCQ